MDQTKIWEFFQNDAEAGGAAFNARPRYEFLASQIAPGMHALNIGVGRGGLEDILVPKGVRVSVLDPGERAIEMIREAHNLGDAAKVGYSQDMPFGDGIFDVVVACELVEHLTDDVLRATMRESARVLKPGGRFIGTTPADENLLASLVVCPHCGERFHRWGHVQHFDAARLTGLLEEQFRDVRLTRHFFGDFRTLNWKGQAVNVAKKVLVGLGFKGTGETFGFSGARG